MTCIREEASVCIALQGEASVTVRTALQVRLVTVHTAVQGETSVTVRTALQDERSVQFVLFCR